MFRTREKSEEEGKLMQKPRVVKPKRKKKRKRKENYLTLDINQDKNYDY